MYMRVVYRLVSTSN